VQSISSEALDVLQRHSWPGNVRELQSVLREALIVSSGPTLLAEFLPLAPTLPPVEAETPATIETGEPADWNSLPQMLEEGIRQRRPELYRRLIHRFDLLVVSHVMKAVGGLQSRAAEVLGLSRPTLRAKLRLIAQQTTESKPLS
jgi:two-component system nitrogen regulation response regulator GlnG